MPISSYILCMESQMSEKKLYDEKMFFSMNILDILLQKSDLKPMELLYKKLQTRSSPISSIFYSLNISHVHFAQWLGYHADRYGFAWYFLSYQI